MYLAEENWGGLARDAQSLVDLVPESAEGWYLRAAFHLNTGDLDDAASDIEAARERLPNVSRYWCCADRSMRHAGWLPAAADF